MELHFPSVVGSTQSGFVETGLLQLCFESLYPRREVPVDDPIDFRLPVSLHCVGFVRALFVAMDPVPVVALSQSFREQGRLQPIGHGSVSGGCGVGRQGGPGGQVFSGPGGELMTEGR